MINPFANDFDQNQDANEDSFVNSLAYEPMKKIWEDHSNDNSFLRHDRFPTQDILGEDSFHNVTDEMVAELSIPRAEEVQLHASSSPLESKPPSEEEPDDYFIQDLGPTNFLDDDVPVDWDVLGLGKDEHAPAINDDPTEENFDPSVLDLPSPELTPLPIVVKAKRQKKEKEERLSTEGRFVLVGFINQLIRICLNGVKSVNLEKYKKFEEILTLHATAKHRVKTQKQMKEFIRKIRNTDNDGFCYFYEVVNYFFDENTSAISEWLSSSLKMKNPELYIKYKGVVYRIIHETMFD